MLESVIKITSDGVIASIINYTFVYTYICKSIHLHRMNKKSRTKL